MFIAAPRLAISVFVALGIAMALSACGSNPDTAPVSVAAIVINSPDGSIPVSGTMQFSATVTDANGNTISGTPTWTLVNGGGTITTGGLFTAGDSVGTFTNTIVATIGTVTSASSVTVAAGGLASITITPALDSIPLEETQQFTAVGHDAFGHVVDIPAGLVWSVSSDAAGTVDTSGHFTAGTVAGAHSVIATSGSIAGHASIIVLAGPLAAISVSPDTVSLAPGATQQYTAIGKDAHGNVVAITPTWAALAGGTVSNTGLFTAGDTAGVYLQAVSATSGVIAGGAMVHIMPGALASISVSPANTSINLGGGVQYSATGHDTFGNVVEITPVWSVSNSTAGSISISGHFTASATPGTYANAIVATSGLISGATGVTVWNPIIILPPICLPYCGSPCFPPCVP